MATIDLNWDNTAVNASANATGQRASKRITAVGGAWLTTGFLPVNDLPKTANTTVATVTVNRVYQFKVEALCAMGGPTINSNGIKEGIVFECVGNTEGGPGENAGEVFFRHTGFDTAVDINKVKFELYDETNTTLIDTSPELDATAPPMEHTFTGLTPGDEFCVRVVYGAMVDGVQVWSEFDEETCLTEGLIASGTECRTYQITSTPDMVGSQDFDWTDCDGNPQTDSMEASQIRYVCARAGTVTVDDPPNQAIVNIGAGCMLLVVQNVGTGATIDSITPAIYTAPTIGAFPAPTGSGIITAHGAYNANIDIGISDIVVPITVTVKINGVVSGVPTVISTNGVHSIGVHTWADGDEVDISAHL